MRYTIFIEGEDKKRIREISNHFLSAGGFIISDSPDDAAIRIKLDVNEPPERQISIYAAERNLVLPSAICPDSLVMSAQLLAASSGYVSFEQTDAFPLMQKMVNVVGHDIRNPLNNILLATAQFRLETLPDAEETAMYIDIIERSCDRINNLMTEIAEPLSGQALNTSQVSLKHLMELIAAEHKAYLELYGISWKLDAPSDSMLQLDADKMRIAINHIIENAIESMKGGGGISVTIGRDASKGAYLLISDSGSGINKEFGKKVFYPFFTTKERKKGLGLTLAEKIVTAHGGYIDIKSEVGSGTHVTISFPSC